jgi:divalent metal cation (Fe/Co/Zn/Cd) transporter
MRVSIEIELSESQLKQLRAIALEHPKGHRMIDLVVRKHGSDQWYEADWFFSVLEAILRETKP